MSTGHLVAPSEEARRLLRAVGIMAIVDGALLAGAYLATVAQAWGRLWVALPLAIMVVLLGVVGGYLTPQERRLAELAERGEDAAHDLLARSVTRAAGGCAVLVVVAVAVMVLKPG